MFYNCLQDKKSSIKRSILFKATRQFIKELKHLFQALKGECSTNQLNLPITVNRQLLLINLINSMIIIDIICDNHIIEYSMIYYRNCLRIVSLGSMVGRVANRTGNHGFLILRSSELFITPHVYSFDKSKMKQKYGATTHSSIAPSGFKNCC